MQRTGPPPTKFRRPFWHAGSNYYLFAAAVAIIVFILLFSVLHDGSGEVSWVEAAIGAIAVFTAAAVMREVLVRRTIQRIAAERNLDRSLEHASNRMRSLSSGRAKFTLEQNTAILREIQQKSDAAKVFGNISDGHREVVVLCEQYMSVASAELPRIGAGSPRLAAIKKGSELAGRYHRYHMLQWAELDARSFLREASMGKASVEKIPALERAVETMKLALDHYPAEEKLSESLEVLQEYLASTRVGHWIEQAERAYFKSDYEMAVNHYQDALFDLLRYSGDDEGKQDAASKIQSEIDRIREIAENS